MKNAMTSMPERKPRERQMPPQMVPDPVPGEADLVAVDTTWERSSRCDQPLVSRQLARRSFWN